MLSQSLNKDTPILITGCARSGTSLVAGTIHTGGAWKGETYGGGNANIKGFFENKELREKIDKPLLKEHGWDPMGQSPLPDITQALNPGDLYDRVQRCIAEQGYTEGPWMFKDAKLTWLWRAWHFAFPEAKWVFVRRSKRHIVQSCIRTSFMSRYTSVEEWAAWVDFHLEQLDAMKAAGLNVVEIWSNDLVEGNYGPIKETMLQYGLNWDLIKVNDLVTPDVWHN